MNIFENIHLESSMTTLSNKLLILSLENGVAFFSVLKIFILIFLNESIEKIQKKNH